MKKLIILFIISCFIIMFIYNKNYQRKIEILSINSLNEEENYNNYLSTYLSKSKLNYKLNIDFTNKSLEIENLIAKINNNDNKIKTYIHSSDVIILSLGNVDYKSEQLNTIISEYKELFKLLRTLNNEMIIFISPKSIKNTYSIKEICQKYKIIFINGSSFKNNKEIISQIIYRKIENAWDKEKY